MFCASGSNSSALQLSARLKDECFVDILSLAPPVIFSLGGIVLLLLVHFCGKYRKQKHVWTLFPGHEVRWLIFLGLYVINIAEIGEGILSNSMSSLVHYHLYITPCVFLCGNIVANIFYHRIEMFGLSKLLIWLILYWITALLTKLLKWNFTFMEGLNVNFMRFDLTFDNVAAYLAMIVLDVYVLIKLKYLCRSRSSFNTAEDFKSKEYVYNFVCFPSKVSFHWVNGLLWSGYQKPLELVDLGKLPKTEWCTTNFSKFKRIFTAEKKSSQNGNVTSWSLWKCYLKCFWPMLTLSAVYKLLGDLLIISGPLCLRGLVIFVEQSQQVGTGNGTDDIQEKYYVDYIEFYTNGYVLVVMIFVTAIFSNTFLNASIHLCIRDAVRLKMSLQALIYEKTMQLSSWSLTQGAMTQGQIVNHMAVDTQHIMFFFYFIHFNWSMLVTVVLVLLLLYLQLGNSGLLGTGVMLSFLPVQYILARLLVKFQKKMLEVSDDRMKKVNELFQGIKLIKLYAWEGIFCKLIDEVRWRQIRLLFKSACISAFNTLVNQGIPVIVTLVTFAFYTYIEGQILTASVAFSALSLFNILSRVLMLFPMIVRINANAKVSTDRIGKFLNAPEIQRTWCTSNQEQDEHMEFSNGHLLHKMKNGRADSVNPDKSSEAEMCDSTAALTVDDGNFTWDLKVQKPYLTAVNFRAQKGELTMIVGSVGSGKTSLLAALLGEMYRISGNITWNSVGSVAYAAQRPWLINDSLKDNILFGRAFDTDRYNEILEVCALKQDISMLPAGDETEIGEKGINLSGGQKARVSLARAMYSSADILILDDPFSALDMHVGSHIFEEGIVKLLLSNKRTVILVTHHLQYMTQAKQIYRLENGLITHSGTLADIKSNYPDLFETWQMLDKRVRTQSEVSDPSSDVSDSVRHQDTEFLKKQLRTYTSFSMSSEVLDEDEFDCMSTGSGFIAPEISVASALEASPLSRSVSVQSPMLIRKKLALDTKDRPEDIPLVEKQASYEKKGGGGSLVKEEERERGSVSPKIYWAYMKAYSVALFVMVLVLKLGQTSSMVGTNFWLAKWSSESSVNISEYSGNETDFLETGNGSVGSSTETLYYIRVYSLLSGLTLILTLFSAVLFYLAGVRASAKLHKKMLNNVAKAPMRYFDTTPTGRILNRFSGDIGVIDDKLIGALYGFLYTVLHFLSAVIVNSIATPFFLLIVAPSVVVYYFIQKFFRATCRELQRLDSIAKSPVLAHFSESIGGLETIRAYGQQDRFMETMFDKINTNSATFLWLNTVNRWLGLRLDHLGAVIVLGASLCSLFAGLNGYISAGLVGLSVSYSLIVCNYLNWVVRCVAETEMHMNAVERVVNYSNVKTEPLTIPTTDTQEPSSIASDWPKTGCVVYKNVSLRYDTELEPVVHGINLSISAGEKIGICGRTGSGKSTLTLGLFRLIDKSAGQISIDGINIDEVPLYMLRERIAIIPQDPVLFGGTVRFNLDPEGTKSDSELWEALEIAQLKQVIDAHGQQLENLVSEGGENYSVGQRQLFCLARAFLKKSSILVMDEATSSIDHQTDELVQQVIHTAFNSSTVITIAHRVSTILKYDRVVVLSEGQILECDRPDNLLQLNNSVFSSLAKKH